jgi:tRNA threonylcarbamoyladenosine biosynthesis protein TsaE
LKSAQQLIPSNGTDLLVPLENLTETQRFGESLAKEVPAGSLLLLEGSLGSGKTSFAQGFLRGAGIKDKVTSPTFAICNRYEAGDAEIHHYDLYRIEKLNDLIPIGFEESVESGATLLIEWSGCSLPLLYGEVILLRFRHAGERREVVVSRVPVESLSSEEFLVP